MIVTLDQQRIDSPLEAGCTLGQLLDTLRTGQNAAKLITGVVLNGEPLTEANAEALMERTLSIGDQVDVETGASDMVVADALREISEALQQAGEASPGVAARLSAGDIAGAMQDVMELITVWQNGRTAIAQAGALLQRDLGELHVDDRSVADYLQELVQKLTDVRDAMVAKDMVLLADLLHYEMPEMCETWSRVLSGVADIVLAESAAS